MKNAFKILFGGAKGKRPLGRPGRRWKDNIKMDHREMGFGCVEWIQDGDMWWALVNTVMNLRFS
jgi:hypothetical protein